MDSNRFHQLAKALAEPHTRRRVVGLFGGTAMASAAPGKDKPSTCCGRGPACTNAKQCCSGICTNRRCAPQGSTP